MMIRLEMARESSSINSGESRARQTSIGVKCVSTCHFDIVARHSVHASVLRHMSVSCTAHSKDVTHSFILDRSATGLMATKRCPNELCWLRACALYRAIDT